METRIEGLWVHHQGIKVRAWPPVVEPPTPKGYSILDMILSADEQSPFWHLACLVPKGARESGCGWKSAYMWEPNPLRADQLLARCPAALILFSYECPNSPVWIRGQIAQAFEGDDMAILRAVGYPGERAFLRVLSRMTRRVQQRPYFRTLRDAWQHKSLRKMLPHLRRINGDVLALLKQTPDRISWRLLEAAQMSAEEDRTISWAVTMLVSEWLLTARHRNGGLPPPQMPWPYKDLHPDHIHTAIYRLHRRRSMDAPFPPEPFPRTDTIVPITDDRKLLSESRKMKNCSVHFTRQILSGEVYFYSLRRCYSRCTVVIKNQGDRWVLFELKAWNNTPPSIQALHEVMTWLRYLQPNLSDNELDQRPQRDLEGWWDEECQ